MRAYGALGNGTAIDSGGDQPRHRGREPGRRRDGAVPAGRLCELFHPAAVSRVTLHLEHDATILAADPPPYASDTDGYDLPEDNIATQFPYQDFGHSHWRNSLISGIDLHDIAIEGRGLIWGRGLVNGDFEPGKLPAMQPGVGNKAIALRGCRKRRPEGTSRS